ncbi:MAG: GIY-YIG nuclease family protein [Clostridia bacterium]|nr:GIY-YIG nuclease family protein [Clostridia bacterium]
MEKPYFVYLLRCADHSLYTGITTDVARRFAEHNGKSVGAKYTASRTPVRMERVWRCGDRAVASRLEYRIKKTLTHNQKELLVADPALLEELLGHVIDVSCYQEECL